MASPFRQRLQQLHLWCGLVVGLLLVVVALTGALLVFRSQLEPVLEPRWWSVVPRQKRMLLDESVRQAQAAYPEGQLDFVRIYRKPSAPLLCQFKDKTVVFLNPFSGELLGVRGRYSGFFGSVEFVHRMMFIGRPAALLAGGVALAAVFLVASGLILWVPPTWRAVSYGLFPNPRLKGRARWSNLHRVVGILSGIIVLSSALTGLPQAWSIFRQALNKLAGAASLSAVPSLSQPVSALLPMEAYWQRVLQTTKEMPEETLIYAPGRGKPVEIIFIAYGAAHINARSCLYLKPDTGEVMSSIPFAEDNAGRRWYYWLVSWHTAELGGAVGKVVLFGGALAVPLLAVTGGAIYFKGRRRELVKNGSATAAGS